MNLPRLYSPRTLSSLLTAYHSPSPLLAALTFPPLTHRTKTPPLTSRRPAAHASEGRANGAAAGPGKRLGAKKSASELVVPGNIIFRQRGTHWFPGENCGMGRDHTIFATEKGYVTYYADPERHPKRKYIGVVFERGQRLPVPRNAVRRRRLGMVTREMGTLAAAVKGEGEGGVGDEVLGEGEEAKEVLKEDSHNLPAKVELRLKPGYMYREANWQIGRAAERAKVSVRSYKPGDRFAAWRKTNARKAKNALKRIVGSRRKK